jgi:16S rRNA processing protein RimM
MARDVLLAVVIAPHGLKGEVKAKIFTAAPDALLDYRKLHTKSGHVFDVLALRVSKAGEAVLSLQGVASREAAEALKGTELFVTRDALPATDENEFYHADLIGLAAEDAQGTRLGTISAIHNFGAGDVIEIRLPDGDDILLPFDAQSVPTIDIENGRIVVAPPPDDEAEERHGVE